jgi:hypothetical protein
VRGDAALEHADRGRSHRHSGVRQCRFDDIGIICECGRPDRRGARFWRHDLRASSCRGRISPARTFECGAR